ncbi:unnamed protein product [Toxocara canis]|uniref:G_PROTEIN_RECEP_F1_2 domain-containing protein n=1 Tax=Toxocara canis TaxID=6265 RepID=A0A183UUK1_TOXCA|nr:unnamed protein product [Toxocara canis]
MANSGHISNCSISDVSILADTIDGPITTVVVLLGVIGNGYSTRVLLKTHINSSMVVSLTSLAIWDIALLVSSFVHHSLASNARLFYTEMAELNSLAASLNGLVVFSYITATWMLIEVTARRFAAVARPWISFSIGKRRRRFTDIRSSLSVARTPFMIAVFAAIISLPASFEYRTVACLRNSKYTTQVEETEVLRNPLYRFAFRLLLMALLKTFGPFIIIIPLTFATLSEYRRSLQRRAIILLEQKLFSLRDSDRDKANSLQVKPFFCFHMPIIAYVNLQMIQLHACVDTTGFYVNYFYRFLQQSPVFVTCEHPQTPNSYCAVLVIAEKRLIHRRDRPVHFFFQVRWDFCREPSRDDMASPICSRFSAYARTMRQRIWRFKKKSNSFIPQIG